jgi:hypothetical protein
MTTLRRELIQKIHNFIDDIPIVPGSQGWDDYVGKLADSILELRAFTDEESPEYKVKRGSDEWKQELGEKVAEKSLEAAVYSGQAVKKKTVNKQAEVFELETLIDEQLTRIGMNWTEEDDREKEKFREFLKKQKKEGKTLNKWTDWWMMDEWRVAHPPWNLPAIRKQWNKAFINQANAPEVKQDDNEVPMSY